MSTIAAQSSAPSAMFYLLMVGVVVLIAVGIYLDYKRKQKIQAFAAARGLTYAARDDRWVHVDTGYPMGQGHSHKAKHVMTGSHDGRPIVIYEHQWTTGSGKDQEVHHARKTLTGLPRSLPRLEVSEEGFFGRTARRMGIKDIELESEAFNRQYKVNGDRKFAYDVLHPRFMEWMLQTSSSGFTINGPYIAFTCGGRIDLKAIDRDVAYLDAVIGQLPRYVIGG